MSALDTSLVATRAGVPTAEELLDEFPGFELPLLSLGTLFRADDSVAVSGSVSPDAAATAELTINGHRVAMSEWGNFCTTVRLRGKPVLTLSLTTENGTTITLDVPLNVSQPGAARPTPTHDTQGVGVRHNQIRPI
jgi:hypothetical protein